MNVLYRDSKGEIFKIPEKTPFKKGEDWEEIGTEASHDEAVLADSIAKIANAIGKSVDETITLLTEALGIPKCPVCQMRGKILRRMGELGLWETLRRLRATFSA